MEVVPKLDDPNAGGAPNAPGVADPKDDGEPNTGGVPNLLCVTA